MIDTSKIKIRFLKRSAKTTHYFSFSASEASSSVSGVSSASSTIKKVEVAKKDLTAAAANATSKDSDLGKASNVGENGNDEVAAQGGVEGEDTMKNLRKTFAGIFGDIGQ